MFGINKLFNFFFKKEEPTKEIIRNDYEIVRNRVNNLYIREFNFKFVYIHFERHSVNPFIKNKNVPYNIYLQIKFCNEYPPINVDYNEVFDLDENILKNAKCLVNQLQYLIYPNKLKNINELSITFPLETKEGLIYKKHNIFKFDNVKFKVYDNNENSLNFYISYQEYEK